MSFAAFDATEYLGDVASNGGWYSFAERGRAEGGALAALCEEGWTEDLPGLVAGLERMKTAGGDESVRAGLLALARRAKVALVVSDSGVEEE